MKHKMCLLLVAVVAISCTNQGQQEAASGSTETSSPLEEVEAPQHNVLTTSEEEQGWELLFDGSSSQLWRGYGSDQFPTHGWKIHDGQLIVEKTPPDGTGGGDIITREQFQNFELSLEFMFSDSANSGILYLAQEQENTPIWHSAPEYQILDNQTYLGMEDPGFGMNTHLTGDNYDLQAAPSDFSKGSGEWNSARIIVDQGHVEHWLNGHKTVEYEINSDEWKALVEASKFVEYPEYGQAVKGHIGLQDHGHEVRFRNIKIRKL